MKMASINQQDCIGCGACVEICPEVFAFNDDEESLCHQTRRGR